MCEAMKTLMKDEIEEVVTEGKNEKAKEMAISLSQQGVTTEIIAKAAGVSEEIVEEWLKHC